MIGTDKVEEILKEFVDGGEIEQIAEEKFGCKLCDLGRDLPHTPREKNSARRRGHGRAAGRREESRRVRVRGGAG